MPNSIAAQVMQIAADLFEEPLATISLDSSPQTLPRWDSLQHLNLVLSLEETFGLQISPEDAEAAKTIGSVVDLVERQLAQR